MIYEEYAPSRETLEDVEAFWRFRLEGHEPKQVRHVIPPDGAVNLCLQRGPDDGAFVSVAGPSDRAHVRTVERGVVYVGARLRPGGCFRAPGAEPETVAHGGLGEPQMDAALVAWTRRALGPLMDGDSGPVSAAFAAWPFSREARDAAVASAADRLIAAHGDARIDALAREAGVSERTLRRRFISAVGLSPKTFARLRRLRRACVLSLEANARSAAVSVEAGYADQAHLSRAALESFGAPPGAVTAYLRQIRHVFAE